MTNSHRVCSKTLPTGTTTVKFTNYMKSTTRINSVTVTDSASLPPRWALKASRAVRKLKIGQRQYLIQKFEDGEHTHIKLDLAKIAADMRIK